MVTYSQTLFIAEKDNITVTAAIHSVIIRPLILGVLFVQHLSLHFLLLF